MITKIQKWGNSQGLRLSKDLLAEVNAEIGDSVEVTALDGTLVIRLARRVRGGVDLAELIGRIPEGYIPEEDVWGAPVGREVW